MKRLLVVLFGVLVFQGSAWALTSGGGLCQKNGDGGKARVLSPADTQQLNKGSAILLQWKDSENWLGNKVTIELHSRKGETEQLVKPWPLQINTGSALITRADLRGAKIKKASKKDIRYFFRLKNHARPKRSIDSGCFTFTKSEKSQRQRRNLKEEIEGLDSTLALALVIISDLTARLDALEGGGTVNANNGAGPIGGNVPTTMGQDLAKAEVRVRFPNGTAWTQMQAQNQSLEACWCDGEDDPVGYCTARGWAVGTLQPNYNLKYNRDSARTLALDGIVPDLLGPAKGEHARCGE